MFLRKLLQILLNYFPLPQNKHLDCLYLDHAADSCQHELSFLPQACFSQCRNLTLPDKPSVSGHLNKATFLNDISLQLTYNHQENARAPVSDILLLQTLKGTRWVWTNSYNTAILETAQHSKKIACRHEPHHSIFLVLSTNWGEIFLYAFISTFV